MDFDAEIFLDDARDFASGFESTITKKVNSDIAALIGSFRDQDVAESIFVKYDEAINALLSDVKNKEQALDKYELILKEIKNASAN